MIILLSALVMGIEAWGKVAMNLIEIPGGFKHFFF